jgi:hypothetical protein
MCHEYVVGSNVLLCKGFENVWELSLKWFSHIQTWFNRTHYLEIGNKSW